MNKAVVAVVMVAATFAVFAEKAALSAEEIAAKKAAAQQKMLQRTGGFVVRPGTQQGEIVYVNCQSKADKTWINASIDYFAEQTKFKLSLKDGAFDLMNPKVEGNATLFIVDDEKLPALLVAPENRWAMVNVAGLAKDKGSAFFEARVKKELSRGFAMLCGAQNSQYPGTLVRGITKVEELDFNSDPHQLPVDVLARFKPYMESLGVKPALKSTYRNACKQGWAPAPTNDYQKAIWEEVHTIPTQPLKIKYEKKDAAK